MRIASLSLINFMCFRGEHTLTFENKAYAIFAHRDDDPEASNWSGKTAFVEAIKFAFDGSHRHRLDDDWITEGEARGEVRLVFDTGETIVRSRERKHASKLWLHLPGVANPLHQAEAQKQIEKLLGLSSEDFTATCFFAQRQMARIILARPEDRMGMISAWLRLDPLERCEDKARARVTDLLDDQGKLLGRREAARRRLLDALSGSSRELAAHAAKEAEKGIQTARDILATHELAWQDNERRRTAQAAREDLAAMVVEGKALAAQAKKVDLGKLRKKREGCEAEERAANMQLGAATQRARQLASAARGQFDGKCPVAAITCPAQAQINVLRDDNATAYDNATAEAQCHKTDASMASSAVSALDAQIQEADRTQRKLDDMRKRAEALAEEVDSYGVTLEPNDPTLLHGRLALARARVEESVLAAERARSVLMTIDLVDKEEASIDVAVAANEKEVQLARAALVILGKGGAQKKIAEEVLGQIEQDANDKLTLASIPLTISVQWSREGQGLAQSCDACGAAYPTSAKVKVCTRCAAPRGPKQINKLDIVLSDRSGAAEDLAGIALQLAASDWLRADRGSEWKTVVIDEAFGQLDASNRRALSQHLGQLIGTGMQAFVIAHHAQVLDALPGRLLITRKGSASSIQVVT